MGSAGQPLSSADQPMASAESGPWGRRSRPSRRRGDAHEVGAEPPMALAEPPVARRRPWCENPSMSLHKCHGAFCCLLCIHQRWHVCFVNRVSVCACVSDVSRVRAHLCPVARDGRCGEAGLMYATAIAVLLSTVDTLRSVPVSAMIARNYELASNAAPLLQRAFAQCLVRRASCWVRSRAVAASSPGDGQFCVCLFL